MHKVSADKKWFTEIFEENFEYIRNYLYYLSGDIELTEDLVQDVFLRLWEKRDTLNDETLRSYLFSIARNCFLKNVRRQKYDLKFRSALLNRKDTESPEFLLEMKEFDQRLQKVIAGMPEKCRTVFLMSRHDGMSYREIAERFNVSIKAVEKQMSKALAILREQMVTNE
jgi:RNA polymerase sigma-70 factor (family 1)